MCEILSRREIPLAILVRKMLDAMMLDILECVCSHFHNPKYMCNLCATSRGLRRTLKDNPYAWKEALKKMWWLAYVPRIASEYQAWCSWFAPRKWFPMRMHGKGTTTFFAILYRIHNKSRRRLMARVKFDSYCSSAIASPFFDNYAVLSEDCWAEGLDESCKKHGNGYYIHWPSALELYAVFHDGSEMHTMKLSTMYNGAMTPSSCHLSWKKNPFGPCITLFAGDRCRIPHLCLSFYEQRILGFSIYESAERHILRDGFHSVKANYLAEYTLLHDQLRVVVAGYEPKKVGAKRLRNSLMRAWRERRGLRTILEARGDFLP